MRVNDSILNSGVLNNQGLSQAQLELIAKAPPDQREKLQEQMKLEKQQEVVAFISNVLKKRNEMTMNIINNMR